MKANAKEFKKGMIIIWSGLIADIPGGWQLCNGTNGSPNLQGQFVIGAGAEYTVGEFGGADSHGHDVQGDGHLHGIESGSDIASGTGYGAVADEQAISGTAISDLALPPYYALAYIMKL